MNYPNYILTIYTTGEIKEYYLYEHFLEDSYTNIRMIIEDSTAFSTIRTGYTYDGLTTIQPYNTLYAPSAKRVEMYDSLDECMRKYFEVFI
jgi:hypothetical protein